MIIVQEVQLHTYQTRGCIVDGLNGGVYKKRSFIRTIFVANEKVLTRGKKRVCKLPSRQLGLLNMYNLLLREWRKKCKMYILRYPSAKLCER